MGNEIERYILKPTTPPIDDYLAEFARHDYRTIVFDPASEYILRIKEAWNLKIGEWGAAMLFLRANRHWIDGFEDALIPSVLRLLKEPLFRDMAAYAGQDRFRLMGEIGKYPGGLRNIVRILCGKNSISRNGWDTYCYGETPEIAKHLREEIDRPAVTVGDSISFKVGHFGSLLANMVYKGTIFSDTPRSMELVVEDLEPTHLFFRGDYISARLGRETYLHTYNISMK